MKFSAITLPSNRKFGAFCTTVFLLAGVFFLAKSLIIACTVFVIAAAFLVVTLLKPERLLTLNRLWAKLGILLGRIVTPVILGMVFFGLFTPISILMKLLRRDELRLKLSDRESHWKERSIDNTQTDTFKYQF